MVSNEKWVTIRSTDLEFPLTRHNFCVDTNESNTSVEASKHVCFNYVTTEYFISTNTAVVRSLRSWETSFAWETKWSRTFEECVFLLDTNPCICVTAASTMSASAFRASEAYSSVLPSRVTDASTSSGSARRQDDGGENPIWQRPSGNTAAGAMGAFGFFGTFTFGPDGLRCQPTDFRTVTSVRAIVLYFFGFGSVARMASWSAVELR